MEKQCISSLSLEELGGVVREMGQPAFRAKQIFHWLHQKQVTAFSQMTDQPKALLAVWRRLGSSPRPRSAAASSPRTAR